MQGGDNGALSLGRQLKDDGAKATRTSGRARIIRKQSYIASAGSPSLLDSMGELSVEISLKSYEYLSDISDRTQFPDSIVHAVVLQFD